MMKWLRVLKNTLLFGLVLGLSFGWSLALAQQEPAPGAPGTSEITAEPQEETRPETTTATGEEVETIPPTEIALEQTPAGQEPADSEAAMSEMQLFSDEIIVMTATKRLQKLSEVPGSVTIITEKEIREKGALTLKEVLRNFVGTEFAFEGLVENMRFRGMDTSNNNKILFLLNGRKLNAFDTDDFVVDFGFNLDNVKQIEIIKGPGSSLYGANAFAGVINIITKDGKDLNGLNTKLSLGSKPGDDELSQHYLLSYGKKIGNMDYMVSTTYWRQLGVDPVNLEEPNSLFDGLGADLSLKYKDELVLRGGYHEKNNPRLGSFHSPAPKNKDFQELFYLDAKYNLVLDELSKIKICLGDSYYPKRSSWRDFRDLNRIKIDSLADLPPGVTNIFYMGGPPSPAAAAIGGFYIDLDTALAFEAGTLPGQEQEMEIGALNELTSEIQYELAWPENNYFVAGLSFTHDWSGREVYVTDTVSRQNYALYLQDEYHCLDNLIFLAGARYDYNTDYGSNTSPRGSVIYSPLSGLRFKALYGSAFRAPNFMEVYTKFDNGMFEIAGNENLKPEKIEESEVCIEYELGKQLRFKGGYFYWETRDEIQVAYDFSSPLYIYSPNLSLINPMLLPPMPGLFYNPYLNYMPSQISWTNTNSRIGHGFELESNLRLFPYTQIGLNYARVNVYSRKAPENRSWAEGDSDIFNSMLGFNYENIFFVNLYAHIGRTPKLATGTIKTKWLKQYDISMGGNYQGLGLTLAVYNVFENAVAYDTCHDDYVKGPRIIRVVTEYTYNF